MNITQFIKLIQKNLLVLLMVPVLLASLVWYMTRNESKTYISTTTVYTGIASGASLMSQEPKNVDFFGVKIVFDNFINIVQSRETMEETGIELFAQNLMLKHPQREYISDYHYRELQKKTPQVIKDLIVPGNLDATVQAMLDYKNQNDTNFLYRLLNLDDPHYSVKAISGIKAKRINNSDLIKIEYSNDDPGITKQTLVILTKVFVKKYRNIQQGQSSNVVKYFEEQVRLATQRLKDAEDRLLQFNQKNNIINYYEQSKYIAAQKEELGVKIQNIRMDLVAAEAAVQELESKLNKKELISLNSKKIIKLRDELASLSSKEAYLSATNENGKNDKKLVKLKNRKKELKDELSVEINRLSAVSASKEGLPIQKILGSWLENVVKLEETKSQLSILNERKMEFEQTYKKFAPLGATMKRIEREINVAERAYLELLHSLTLAKLKQQNIEMSASTKIVDEPYFPIKAQPSKRKVLIAAAGIIGGLFTLALIIILEYLDSTIKTPERIKKFTELELAGIYPRLIKYSKRLNIDFVKDRMIEMIIQNFKYKFEKNPNRPKIIIVFSTQNTEGKTKIASCISKMLYKTGLKVMQLNYLPLRFKDDEEPVEQNMHDYYEFKIENDFPEIDSVEKILPEGVSIEGYDYVFMEIPSIIYYQYPVKLLRNSDLNLLVVRSNRNWTKADANALEIIKKANATEPMVVLNGVDIDTLNIVLGEIPKRRSRIRRIIKKVLTMQLRSKYTFK
jgi:uncharacterized protein involved in exopolysaccharide biosynthesis